MRCENCKQARAAVHITDFVPEKRERHLCEVCAEQAGLIIKQHQTANAAIQEFLKLKVGGPEAGDTTCPRCGITFREFQTNGQLGCPNDYEVFRALLTPLIERVHASGAQHVGRVPKTAGEVVRRKTGLMRLRRELREAIERENYESAARLRDEIRTTEAADSVDSP